MNENTFNYFSLRARKARFGNVLNNFFINFLLVLCGFVTALSGLYFLYLKNPLGWLGLGAAVVFVIIFI